MQNLVCNDQAVAGAESIRNPSGKVQALFHKNLRIRTEFFCFLQLFHDIGAVLVRAVFHFLIKPDKGFCRVSGCLSKCCQDFSVDEDGEIDTNTSWSERFKSKASLSIHGIEVPYNLFPDYSNGMSKAALKIPFPFSFRLDIGVNSDLNLNSARDQIIYDEKWLTFEENLYRIICRRLKDTLSSSDWKILNEIIQKNNTDTFSRVANSFE